MQRIDIAVREVISEALARVKDPRVGFVTVTAVHTSPDLRHATVLISVLGKHASAENSLQGLNSAHGFLQRAIARELRLKNTPTLEFIHDDTTERAMRIEQLLRDAETDEETE